VADRAPATRDAFAERFLDAERLAQTLVVELPGADAPVIGDLMVAIQDAWAQSEVAEQAKAVQAELGWVLHPEHQGHGYAREAVAAMIAMCFQDLGLRRVTAGCFAANEASWRMAAKLGMRREATTVEESLHRSGEWMDGYGYALLDEWTPAEPAGWARDRWLSAVRWLSAGPVVEPVETFGTANRRANTAGRFQEISGSGG
jgi:RimJ/RimL family protein N-acetyltransferase